MIKSELFATEHAVFERLLNHWEELECKSLPIVLEEILHEIEAERYLTKMQNFANCVKRD